MMRRGADPRASRAPSPSTTAGATALRVIAAMAAITAALLTGGARAQTDLSDASLEDLMQMDVTSASRRTQALNDTAAAVHVITAEDIRRSGATRLTEVLGMAPGVEVARISGGITAVGIRGFNQQFANKLLVLIDGRSVYTQTYSGVYWDMQNLMLEDIERIEVIRGPGATLWGANAVNGVINIITRSARDTVGGIGYVAHGVEERAHAGLRYGWRAGEHGAVRVYAKTEGHAQSVTRTGAPAGDDYRSQRFGLRGDWDLPGGDRFTLIADSYRGDIGVAWQPTPTFPPSRLLSPEGAFNGSFVLGRWQRALSLSSDVTMQVVHDRFTRSEYSRLEEDTTDVEFQHRVRRDASNDLVWGMNWRHRRDAVFTDGTTVFVPASVSQAMGSVFAQNEARWRDGAVRLVLGARMERSYVGRWEPQPTARLVVRPDERTRLWASLSGAARTPSRLERDAHIDLPGSGFIPGMSIRGANSFRAEHVTTWELGWRRTFAQGVALDATLFLSRYRHGRTTREWLSFQPFTANLEITNEMDGSVRGVELGAVWPVTRHWRLNGQLSLLDIAMRDAGTPGSLTELSAKGSSPRTQLAIASRHDLPHGWTVDASTRYVGALRHPYNASLLQGQRIDSYVDLTVRVGWRVHRRLELALVGRHLLAAQRLEFVSENGAGITQRQRSLMLRASFTD
jgi:iron complex outermembrane receptor protein